jgi:hypothetical protein
MSLLNRLCKFLCSILSLAAVGALVLRWISCLRESVQYSVFRPLLHWYVKGLKSIYVGWTFCTRLDIKRIFEMFLCVAVHYSKMPYQCNTGSDSNLEVDVVINCSMHIKVVSLKPWYFHNILEPLPKHPLWSLQRNLKCTQRSFFFAHKDTYLFLQVLPHSLLAIWSSPLLLHSSLPHSSNATYTYNGLGDHFLLQGWSN